MREVLAALQSLLDDLEALLATIENMNAPPTPAEEEAAREMLRRLKDRLRGEHRRTWSVKGRSSLNLVERTYYAPAVQEAHEDLRIGTDAPPGDSWIADLLSARLDIEPYARQLREALSASS